MATINEVIQAAMTLGKAERMQLSELLWGSLPTDSQLELNAGTREEIQLELRAAWDDYQSGRDPGKSWREVQAEMRRNAGNTHDDA